MKSPKQTPQSKTWLVTPAITVQGILDFAKHNGFPFLVEAESRDVAELIALHMLVPEAFSEEPPFVRVDSEAGTWQNDPLRFELSKDGGHAEVDAGNIYGVDCVKAVEPADIQILEKYIGSPVRMKVDHKDAFREAMKTPKNTTTRSPQLADLD